MLVRFSLTALVLLLAACAAPVRTVAPGGVTGEAASPSAGAEAYAQRASADRQLVRAATLTLEVDDDDQRAAVRDGAAELAEAFGGYVEASTPRDITLRVPDGRLIEALDALSALADETGREIRAADVTDQVTDLEIRLANARALRDRLAALLDDADTVQDVLAVERELARVTTEVERLEAQVRDLGQRVTYATVRLRLVDDVKPGPIGYVFVGLYEGIKWLFVRD